jgi:hypothetical protein
MNRTAPVSQRAKTVDAGRRHCRVIGCPFPARASTPKGLDTRFCRRHADHYSRHGSPYKRTYPAAALTPYRLVVRRWLSENREDRWLKIAISGVRALYDGAGPHVEAFRLAGMTPRERARKAWARLRNAKVDPIRVVEAWLVAELAVRLDPQPDGKREFKQVQAAKLIHRLASGSHKRWEREAPYSAQGGGSSKIVTELHKYPHSRGKVLRYVGADLEAVCEHLVSAHLNALVSLCEAS